MFRADAAARAPGAGYACEDIALPLGGSGGDFSVLMRQVDAEVRSFIENGSAESGLASQNLSAHALALFAAKGGSEVSGREESGEHEQAFLASLRPWLGEAASRLGVSEEVLAAQAALESGWGQKPIRSAAGRDTNNLFGVKAGRGWRGEATEESTTEYVGAVAVPRSERFRSYADAGEAIRDFSRLIAGNPRYRAALNTGSDARAYGEALVRGGYATDPAYAEKLVRIAARLQSGD